MFKLFKPTFSQATNPQQRQAVAEYWPILPVAIIIILTASFLVGPSKQTTLSTDDRFNLVVCDFSVIPPSVNLNDTHHIEIISKASSDTVRFPVTMTRTADCPDSANVRRNGPLNNGLSD